MTNAIAVVPKMIPPVARNLVRIKLTRIGDSLIVDIECGNYELACIIDRFTLMLVSYLRCRSSEILHYLFSKSRRSHDPARTQHACLVEDDLSMIGEKEENIPIHLM